MANVRCPMCGKPNPPEVEECQFCGARIKPALASSPAGDKPIKPGENPTKKDTSEFEKVKRAQDGSIHPGDAPTKKNTAELEQALPSWLRSLREGKSPAAGESTSEPGSNENPSVFNDTAPASDASSGLPDWLAGLGSTGTDDDEDVPDWLAGLRDDKPADAPLTPAVKDEPPSDLGNLDWMGRLGAESGSAAPEPAAAKDTPAFDASAFNTSAFGTPPDSDETPDWLQSIPTVGVSSSDPFAPTTSKPTEPANADNTPDWLSGLTAISPVTPPASESTPADDSPDWLNNLQKNAPEPEAVTPGSGDESIPDWLSSFGPEPGTPASATGESVPEWLSDLETKSGPGSGSSTALLDSDSQPAGDAPAGDAPDWLSQLQGGINTGPETEQRQDDIAAPPDQPAPIKKTSPLPDWLSGINRTETASDETSARLGEAKAQPTHETGETAFSMETPDWLSKLKPEQAGEKGNETPERPAGTANLDTSELPSWVQAMRPVESVISEATTNPQDDGQVTEQSGPLAGLHGVLPAGPGLGPLRKPPAYSVKLQVSDGQQRYAAFLEHLVAGESQARPSGRSRLTSSRFWRWLIAIVLILAIILPVLGGTQISPATLLSSSDNGATYQQIEQLPANVPVLAVFDYEPALSGELEAIAAPVFDQLLSKGTPLAVLSTSPTGPTLADRFLKDTPLVDIYQYQNGQQYINLGYLAGGPTGISSFAMDPLSTIKNDTLGEPAWSKASLVGVQRLSDFAAILILTDNADTGRNWIEQTSQYLSKNEAVDIPVLMIISAQSEPMVQPYFNSGQLKGIVSGVSDAKIYEQHYARPGRANQYWSSFSTATLVAEVLIAIGAIWSTLAGWRARRNKSGEEA